VSATVLAPPSVAREFGAFGLRLLQYAMLFLGTLIAARALGPSARAHYALPFALSGTVWVIGNLTIEGAAGRLVGRGEVGLEQVTGLLASCTLLMSVLGVGVTMLVGLLGRGALLGGAGSSTVVAAALSIPGLLATQIAGYVLLLSGRVRLHAIAGVIAAAVQVMAVVAIALDGAMTPLLAAVATTGGFLLSGALMIAALAGAIGPRALMPGYDRELMCALLRLSVAIHPMSIAIGLGPRLELLIVGAMAGARDTGLYSLALTIAQVPMFASFSLAQAGAGPLTGLDRDAAIAYGCEFTRQVTLVALAIAVALGAAAFPFVLVAYGGAWRGSVLPLVIMLAGAIALGVECPLRVLLLRFAAPAALAAVAIGAVVLNGTLTVILFGPWRIAGAAVASLLAYWAFAAGMVALLRRAAPDAPLRRCIRPLTLEDWVLASALGHARSVRRLARSTTWRRSHHSRVL
jgi:O-antigen/teichoic acid export membrane protein